LFLKLTLMHNNPSMRPHPVLTTVNRRPVTKRRVLTFEGLEGRALLASGQITLQFLATSSPGNISVKGSMPDTTIDLLDVSLSSQTSASVGSTSGGAGAGKVAYAPLTFHTYVGSQTGPLFSVLASGAHFNQAQIVFRNGAGQVYLKYDLGLVFVTSQSIDGNSGTQPIETDQLVYGAIRVNYINPTTNFVMNTSSWSVVNNTNTFTVPGIALTPSLVRAPTVSPAAALPTVSPAATAIDNISTSISLKTSKVGSNLALKATVRAKTGVPEGLVTFYDGKTWLGTAEVGADGKATLNIPAGTARKHLFAIFSGGPSSIYAPSSTVSGVGIQQKLFSKAFGRFMTASEWVLNSMWMQQGQTSASLGAVYNKIAKNG
jgi:type VI protein secretion system component Hcp